MRPVTRPPVPERRSNRDPTLKRVRKEPAYLKEFAIAPTAEARASTKDLYGQWRGVMIAAWGKYCSYCEIPMGTGLQVEHKIPKSVAEDSEDPYAGTNWVNMLLSCPSCNVTKKVHPDPTKNEDISHYLWPDIDVKFCVDPTKSAFEYYLQKNVPAQLLTIDASGNKTWTNLPNNEDVVLVRPGGYQNARAQNTMNMLNLNGNYNPLHNRLEYYSEDSDRRVKHRTRAWNYALAATQRLDTVNKAYPGSSPHEELIRELMERQITSTAVSAGFWSAWLTVFAQAVASNTLALAGGETIQMLISRLFLPGIPRLGLGFPGTATARIGIDDIGDLP